MQYHFKIHKEGTGFWAQCIELPGCFTQADSKKELLVNMQAALNLYIEEDADSQDLAALPKKIRGGKNIVTVALEPQVAFAFLVRYWRCQYVNNFIN
ncbi:MAG TPA: type II toxin-antitoxin system HicB family antitoxin [Candidatus Babeliales bacterium]|nr:type II toxin-antitoxin system HicB family antitoxin [Candidatus Babeliales bacterium]